MHRYLPVNLLFGFLLLADAAGGGGSPDDRQPDRSSAPGAAGLAHVFEGYARLAEQGDAVAQYNLAMMYCNGEAVNVDYQQAAYWFGQSAAREFPPAQFRLGEMFYFGRGGLARDLEQAVALFQRAAQAGDADAQVNLAMLLAGGEGLPRDTAAALYWLDEAQTAGHEVARGLYARLQPAAEEGFTAAESREYWDQQRQFWIEKAADFGVREAQEALDSVEPHLPSRHGLEAHDR